MSISFWSVICKATAGLCTLGVVIPPTIAVQQMHQQAPSIEEVVEQETPSAPVASSEPEADTEPTEATVSEEAVVTLPSPEEEYLPPSTELNLPRDPNYPQDIDYPNEATTVGEFVSRYAGKCPHEIPDWEGMKRDHAMRAVLGLYRGASPNEAYATIWDNWAFYKHTNIKFNPWVGGVANGVLENTPVNQNIGFFMDWATTTVYWENSWEENRPDARKATGEYPAEWDAMAAEFTVEFQRIENGYYALCPND